MAWSDDQYLLRYLVVDYLGITQVSFMCLSNLDLKLLMVSRAAGLEYEGSMKSHVFFTLT